MVKKVYNHVKSEKINSEVKAMVGERECGLMEKSNVMLLNDIIYKIHTIEDCDVMRKSVLEMLQYLIPSDILTFYLASPETPYELTRPVGIGLGEDRWQVYLDHYQEIDYTRWTFAAPSAGVYRETDLMNDEARVNTPFYQKMFAPAGIHYSVIMTIIHEGRFLGCINLFRKPEAGDYTDEEVLLLDMLKSHLGFRLSEMLEHYRDRRQTYPDGDELRARYGLTSRETEIAYLLLDGISKEAICDDLCISQNTLKKHTLNIYKKLEINSWREMLKLLK